jgi:hypothetical protein
MPGLPIEAVDERLRNPEAFAFYERCLAVRAFGLDDQVHVRVHPVEPRDCPFDQDLLGHIEHRHAVVRGSRGAQERGRGERMRGGSHKPHVGTSELKQIVMIRRSPGAGHTVAGLSPSPVRAASESIEAAAAVRAI